MGGCLRTPNLNSDEFSTISSYQVEKSIPASITSSLQKEQLLLSSSSPATHVRILKKVSKEDSLLSNSNQAPLVTVVSNVRNEDTTTRKIDLADLNSDDLADFIIAVNQTSEPKPIFEGESSFTSSNFSFIVTHSWDNRSEAPNDMTYTQHVTFYEQDNPSEVLPTIYLGSKDDIAKVTRLKEIGITHILCVSSGKPQKLDGVKLLTVVMADNGNSQLRDIMKRSFPFIEESQKKGNKLLIHCNLGQNRSPTLLIAWLMTKKRWTFYHAHKYVKKARELIQPHKLYLDQLRELDKELFGVYSTPDDYLAIGFTAGELTIAEKLNTAERSAYITSQLNLMSSEQLKAYRKSQANLVTKASQYLF